MRSRGGVGEKDASGALIDAAYRSCRQRLVIPFLALVLVTAIWGVTFVQMKDALELYPLFAFLAVRFLIAVVTLAIPVAPRLRSLGRRGALTGAALGALLAAGYGLQTAGLERTTVSAAG